MLNNIYSIVFIPEIFLTFFSLICLLFGLYIKKNAFRQTCNFAVLILLITAILIYFDDNSNFANYKNLFSHSNFINFFKILVILGSISSILISKEYFLSVKLKNFEIPVLFLFSTLGMLLMISSNNLILLLHSL